MIRAMLRALTLALLSLAAACGSAPQKPDGGHGPALWAIERGGMKGWLFGTIHVLPGNIAWQTPAIRSAMAASDRLVLEAADLQDAGKTLAIFESMGRSPDLPPLENRVPADEKAPLLHAIDAGGADSRNLSGYESWAAAMLLSAASQQSLNISANDGVEPVLIAAYRDAGKPIGGLETVERQFAAFDTLPQDAQDRLLVQTVHESDDMKALYHRILNAWLNGDMDAIAREGAQGEQPDPVIEDAILTARNRDWVKAIEPMRGAPFIAVGAGHLTGADSLIDMLRARGFTVRRVQ